MSACTKKSAAQIRRLQKRAEARGEVYARVQHTSRKQLNDEAVNEESEVEEVPIASKVDEADEKKKLKAAIQLTKSIDLIEKNKDLKAKDRRSAKRKAEAIAAETSGCSASDLLEWYDQQQSTQQGAKDRKNPYIAFVGQLSYETDTDELFQHIKTELENDNDSKTTISKDSVKIRLLTHPKTKKSRGMAFVEVDNPESLYALLKLHHTYLKGRRINVERSSGGGVETRKSKISSFRKEQQHYMQETVHGMLKEYHDRGEIKKEGELDDGVIALCTRHSAAVVQAALERYVESNGRDMDNPSAYLSFLLGKLAEEGIYRDREKDKTVTTKSAKRHKVTAKDDSVATVENKRLRESSTFAKAGVDMSLSESNQNDLLKIFPSISRGRGRGRGYM